MQASILFALFAKKTKTKQKLAHTQLAINSRSLFGRTATQALSSLHPGMGIAPAEIGLCTVVLCPDALHDSIQNEMINPKLFSLAVTHHVS